MSRYLARRWWAIVLVCLIAGLAIAFAIRTRTDPATLVVTVDHDILPADGYAEAHLHVRATNESQLRSVTWQLESGRGLAELERYASDVRPRAGVTPGAVMLIAASPGFSAARVAVKLDLDPIDQFGDGTPDLLRLQDTDDQIAFRRWFAFLAESTYFQKEGDRPPEVSDCAALIRFAYREALRRHDGPWANHWRLPSLPKVSAGQRRLALLGFRVDSTGPLMEGHYIQNRVSSEIVILRQ